MENSAIFPLSSWIKRNNGVEIYFGSDFVEKRILSDNYELSINISVFFTRFYSFFRNTFAICIQSFCIVAEIVILVLVLLQKKIYSVLFEVWFDRTEPKLLQKKKKKFEYAARLKERFKFIGSSLLSSNSNSVFFSSHLCLRKVSL